MPSFSITCAVCPKTFDSSRADARTCSAACRQALHRQTRAAREAATVARVEALLGRLVELAIPKDPR